MKPSYHIGAKNGLLEQKHFEALGNAIWLYLWFLDKQPKDTDKVLGGQPVTYQMFAEAFPKIPRITYVRWLDAIKKGGYVDLLRTPKGYVVTILKAKKWADSDVSSVKHHDVSKKKHQVVSDVSKMNSDVSKVKHPMSKNDTSNIKDTVKQTIINNTSTTNVVLAIEAPVDEKEQIKKLYYECIKAYKLPVLNHTTLHAKINAMFSEYEPQTIIKYLTFMRDQYQRIEISYKPRISNALDFYTKRVQIKEAITEEVKSQQTPRAWRPKHKEMAK